MAASRKRESTLKPKADIAVEDIEVAVLRTSRHGSGILEWSDGKYDGDWFDNCIHGTSVLSLADGRKFAGSFNRNSPKAGYLEDINGSSYYVTYANDQESLINLLE